MTTNKRPFLNPNVDSDDEHVDSKKAKLDETDYDETDETFEDDMSEGVSEDHFSDPDYVPSQDETEDEEVKEERSSDKDIISDDDKSQDASKKDHKEPDMVKSTNSFTSKLDELKAKGITLHRAGEEPSTLSLSKASESSSKVDTNAANNNTPVDPKAMMFAKSIINFPHEKKCLERCQILLQEENLENFALITDASVCFPDFIKSSVSLVGCSTRLGDITMTRKVIGLVLKLGEIPGISPLSQALIGGVRSQMNNIDEVESWEKKGLEAFASKQYSYAAIYVDKALKIASSCIRLKLARGDASVLASKFSEGDKAASSILDQDKNHVAALYLKGYCNYQSKELDKAIGFFQQAISLCPDHQRAKTFLSKAQAIREKKEAAQKAFNKNKQEEAVTLLTLALEIDPRNQGVRTSLLADRGTAYLKLKKPQLALKDCQESLQIDASNFEAQYLKARCLFDSEQFGETVSMLETMNTTDRQAQQKKRQEAEAAARSKRMEEATKLYYEVVEVDRRNGRYRQLLREAKQKHHLASRLDYYNLLGVEKTVEDGALRKAYFKKSREFHPDKHANASEEEREQFNLKFQQAKEAYECLSVADKRKNYDKGTINPPPGGWYRDVDKRFLTTLKRMSESNVVTMPNIRMGNIDIKSASSNRGRPSQYSQPRGGRGRASASSASRGGVTSSGHGVKTGPGITINRVPSNNRGRGRRK